MMYENRVLFEIAFIYLVSSSICVFIVFIMLTLLIGSSSSLNILDGFFPDYDKAALMCSTL